MTFTEAVSACLKKYAQFDGTASRSEFWWFYLFQFIASFLVSLVSPKLSIVVSLALLLPSLAAGCRRLHDTDRTGWLQLLVLIPLVGWIVLLVFFVQEGKPNRYDGGVRDPARV